MDQKKTFNVSTAAKMANDMALAKEMLDYYDFTYVIDDERRKRLDENYQLHSGRWPQLENNDIGLAIALQHENIPLGGGKLRHYPVLDRISKSVVGDIIVRPLIPIVRDLSSKARNQRDRYRIDQVRQYLQSKFVDPIVQQVTQQYMMENGIADPYGMPEEAIAQMQSDIQQRVTANTPDELVEALERFRTPEEALAQLILEETIKSAQLKRKFDMGGEHAVVTGEEYYRLNVLNGEVFMEPLIPTNVIWDGSETVEYSEDGVFAKHETYLTPEDTIARYGRLLLGKDLKTLESLYCPIPTLSGSRTSNPDIERRALDEVIRNPALQQINPRTQEGQMELRQLYAHMSLSHRAGYGIREAYVTWRWTAKMKLVTRVENGKEVQHIRAEHYEKNPDRGDLKVQNILVPQVWHGVKLGEMNGIYANVEPVPYQYKSLQNPFDVKLTIYGGRYNTVMGTTSNVSLVDLGKPWNYRYNVVMKRMEEHEATDIGKVLLGTVSMKPQNWSWTEWFQSLFIGKVAMVSNQFEGSATMNPDIFKSIDMSRATQIADTLQKLEYFEKKIATSMYYNPSKLGQISPYATNQVTEMNMAGSDRQMLKFHERHRIIKERVLNAVLNTAIMVYRDSDYKKNILLDDFSKAYLDTVMEPFDLGEFALHVVDDFQESEKLEQMRSLAMSIMQNGGSVRDLVEIIDARSMADIREILDRSERRRQKETQDQRAHESQIAQQTAEAQRQALELQQMFQTEQNERDREVKLEMARINATLLANANDINQNNQNDSLEKAEKQMELDEKLGMRKLDIEEQKLRQTGK